MEITFPLHYKISLLISILKTLIIEIDEDKGTRCIRKINFSDNRSMATPIQASHTLL